jgi:HPt (histidine-containing phosphotransfer) domain-containing protein
MSDLRIPEMMPQIDVERALRALDGNAELLKDLASMFVEDAPLLLVQLKNALADKRPTQARAVVHGLKGLVATFYAKTGVAIAQRLEDAAAEGDLSLFFNGEFEQLEQSVGAIMSEFEALGWVNRC